MRKKRKTRSIDLPLRCYIYIYISCESELSDDVCVEWEKSQSGKHAEKGSLDGGSKGFNLYEWCSLLIMKTCYAFLFYQYYAVSLIKSEQHQSDTRILIYCKLWHLNFTIRLWAIFVKTWSLFQIENFPLYLHTIDFDISMHCIAGSTYIYVYRRETKINTKCGLTIYLHTSAVFEKDSKHTRLDFN